LAALLLPAGWLWRGHLRRAPDDAEPAVPDDAQVAGESDD
jgi:hypothetical protein